jgi:hypothetical protein
MVADDERRRYRIRLRCIIEGKLNAADNNELARPALYAALSASIVQKGEQHRAFGKANGQMQRKSGQGQYRHGYNYLAYAR